MNLVCASNPHQREYYMLFITNRVPKGSIRTKKNRPYRFDLENNSPGNSLFYCERMRKGHYVELGSADLLQRLRNTDYRQLLFYIHGFSNLPEDVFPAAQEFQRLCDAEKEYEVKVVPVIWPCDNDRGIVGDYWDDQKAADSSAFSFSRALQRFLDWREQDARQMGQPCYKRINVLAHSMGNRVLRETLVAWARYDLASGVPLIFRNAFLIASDIVNESLHKGESGELICNSSRNVLVYFASDDLALRASKAANLKNKIASRRLGHTGPEDMHKTPNNVFAIDCDDVNNLYDNPKGHSYFSSGTNNGPGKVFRHIFSTIRSGRPHDIGAQNREMIVREEE